ncbi:MAG: hypothetical protein R3E83_08240 [Burkholderiaceae bacterium]
MARIPGATVSLSSASGNTLSAASIVTDALGQGRFTVTGANAGADTLTAQAMGTSATFAATVSGTLISYSVPAIGAEVEVGTPTNVSVQITQAACRWPVRRSLSRPLAAPSRAA